MGKGFQKLYSCGGKTKNKNIIDNNYNLAWQEFNNIIDNSYNKPFGKGFQKLYSRKDKNIIDKNYNLAWQEFNNIIDNSYNKPLENPRVCPQEFNKIFGKNIAKQKKHLKLIITPFCRITKNNVPLLMNRATLSNKTDLKDPSENLYMTIDTILKKLKNNRNTNLKYMKICNELDNTSIKKGGGEIYNRIIRYNRRKV